MTGTVDTSEKLDYEIGLSHPDLGDLGQGTLSLGGNSWTHVTFQDFLLARKLASQKIWPIIKAKANNGQVITLLECTVNGFDLFAEYAFFGDLSEGSFKRIEIRYSDISEWFSNGQRIEGTIGNQLTWSNRSKPLSAVVESEKIAIRSEYVSSIEQKGEDQILHEHVEFVVDKITGLFSPADLQRKALEISCLLSILIAYPISLLSLFVMTEDGRLHQAYFPGFEKLDRKLSNSQRNTRSFIQKRALEDRWQEIFTNYYNSKHREVLWPRLSGMQRYSGFWEYRVLGYVGLLDQYASQHAERLTVPASALNNDKLSKLKGAIAKLSSPISDGQRDELLGFLGPMYCKDRSLTFLQKFEKALRDTDADIIKIIDLSEGDFRSIKDVRDAVAHGDKPNIEDKDFTKLNSIVSKIDLLLTYWAFIDFGLKPDDFLRCLCTTHSHLRFESQLNARHLDRVTKSAEFFTVSPELFQKISKIKNVQYYACFFQTAGGEIEYSEHYTAIYQGWVKNPEVRRGATTHEEIFGVEKDQVKYINTAYIESGDNHLELHALFLFAAST